MIRTPTLADLALTVTLLALALPAFADDRCLARAVETADATLQGQVVLSTHSKQGPLDTEVLSGVAHPALNGSEGFRIASVTKTYVAATALRLWEDGKLDLEAPVSRWLPPEWTDLLVRDGYPPERITVRNLLSHTSGLADHAQAPQFIQAIKANPSTQITPADHVRHLIEWTQPVGSPGDQYFYSDTGYILLGKVIEQATGQSLHRAVRAQLDLDRRDLPDTYWEHFEPAEDRVRAHQIFEGVDTHEWSPTMDLYGGGGIVATPRDMAAFFSALLDGKVFRRPQTLALMLSSEGLPSASTYRLGIFAYDFDGIAAYGHSGFWGTLVATEPLSGQTIAGAVTDRQDYPRLKAIVGQYLRQARAEASKANCRH